MAAVGTPDKKQVDDWLKANTTTTTNKTVQQIATGVKGTPEVVYEYLLQLQGEGRVKFMGDGAAPIRISTKLYRHTQAPVGV